MGSPVTAAGDRVAAAQRAADAHLDEFVAELQALCRIPSRRWEPDAMLAAADMVVALVERHGGRARTIPWERSFPYVLGEIAGPAGAPRLLHFNHYDVEIEPAGDDGDLLHPPFGAELHDGALYARGVADDKGPLLSRIHAAAAYRLAGLEPPVTVRFMAEGKQRLDSPGMPSFVAAHADELAADGILWENSWVDEHGRPLLKLGEKGLLALEVRCSTLRRDGSSQNAAVLDNAAWRLVDALATLRAPDGRIALPGFADAVRPLTDETLALIAAVPFEVDRLTAAMGVDGLAGGVTAREAAVRVRTVPTLTITGLASGDAGSGLTLSLPGSARAKLEFRLVADQDPAAVLAGLRAHLDHHGFADLELHELGRTRPHLTPPDDPFVRLVAAAAERAYGAPAILEPATPLVGNQGCFAATGTPIVGIGVGRAWSASDPNQHVLIEDYRRAVHHVIEIMGAMAHGA